MYLFFRERGKEGEKEGNTDWLPSACAQTRDWTGNLGMCPDQGLNLRPLGLCDNAQPSRTDQG